MKLGIDFGSTYSSISSYSPAADTVKSFQAEGVGACIPSVLSVSDDGTEWGALAKEACGDSGVRIFEAFKMLLNENDPTIWRARGYDEDRYTPRSVSAMYLERLIKMALKKGKDKNVEGVHICVPATWFGKFDTLQGRAVLKNILTEDLKGIIPTKQSPDGGMTVPPIVVVSEPEAAGTYIAFNLEKERKKPFNGHVLLVDYGGGTLDLTLLYIKSSGRGNMEIKCVDVGGQGDNHSSAAEGSSIGCAGFAYMQRVVALAMIDQGIVSGLEAISYTDPVFIKTVRSLESKIKHDEGDIEDFFGGLSSWYDELVNSYDNMRTSYQTISWADEVKLVITYQHLFKAYQMIVEPVLREELSKMIETVKSSVKRDPCKPIAGTRDDFKIALVGGFGSYYLVRNQLSQIFNINPEAESDLRVVELEADDRELAVSKGAALLAAGKILLRKTAPYSVGLETKDQEGKSHIRFAIKIRQDIEPGKPYFLRMNGDLPDNDPDQRIRYRSLRGNIEAFVIAFNRKAKGDRATLQPEMMKKLEAGLPDKGQYFVGFAFDESEILHMCYELPREENEDLDILKFSGSFPLEEYSRLFSPEELK